MQDIYVVPREQVQVAWNKVGHMIESAMSHAKGECTAEQLRVFLCQGTSFLTCFVEDNEIVGALVFRFNTTPNHRIFYIDAIGGKTTQAHTEKMMQFARENNCTVMRGSARESVARLWRQKYGFNEIYRIVEKAL